MYQLSYVAEKMELADCSYKALLIKTTLMMIIQAQGLQRQTLKIKKVKVLKSQSTEESKYCLMKKVKVLLTHQSTARIKDCYAIR